MLFRGAVDTKGATKGGSPAARTATGGKRPGKTRSTGRPVPGEGGGAKAVSVNGLPHLTLTLSEQQVPALLLDRYLDFMLDF
jgi:hypothetical protein